MALWRSQIKIKWLNLLQSIFFFKSSFTGWKQSRLRLSIIKDAFRWFLTDFWIERQQHSLVASSLPCCVWVDDTGKLARARCCNVCGGSVEGSGSGWCFVWIISKSAFFDMWLRWGGGKLPNKHYVWGLGACVCVCGERVRGCHDIPKQPNRQLDENQLTSCYEKVSLGFYPPNNWWWPSGWPFNPPLLRQGRSRVKVFVRSRLSATACIPLKFCPATLHNLLLIRFNLMALRVVVFSSTFYLLKRQTRQTQDNAIGIHKWRTFFCWC